MPGTATSIFLSFYVTSVTNSKSGLEVNGGSYLLFFTVFTRNQVDVVEIKQINSKIKDTNNMLEVIYNINKYVLSENYVLVSFDVVNMFPNIINKFGLLSVQETLTDSNLDVDSTQCIADALEICLTCNNPNIKHQHFLQTNRIFICLVLMLTLPRPTMTLLLISSIYV